MAKSHPRKSKASARVPKRSPPRTRRSINPDEWPVGLRLLVKAARAERPKGHGDALDSLIEFALRRTPARGIFEPGDIDDSAFWKEIQDVARAHLGFDGARAEMRAALDKAKLSWEQRDAIEGAALHVQAISDTAGYSAGLAFGLVFASMSEAVSR